MYKLTRIATIALGFSLTSIATQTAEATNPPLGFRDTSAAAPIDYTCEVEDIDDETCELTCDGPGADDFECVCDEDLCECVDSDLNEFTMLPDPDEGSWCDALRRGGGHYHGCCISDPPGGVCPTWCTDKAPPPSPACTPCLYGCTGNVCN